MYDAWTHTSLEFILKVFLFNALTFILVIRFTKTTFGRSADAYVASEPVNLTQFMEGRIKTACESWD